LGTSRIVFAAKLVKGKQLLVSNEFYFTDPKNMALTKHEIKREIIALSTCYSVTLSCNYLTKSVYLSLEEDIRFSYNFFDLLPGEKITVHCITPLKVENFVISLEIISLVDTY
jgi:beta-mannosidase